MPVFFSKIGRMCLKSPDCSVEVVEATVMNRSCACAKQAISAHTATIDRSMTASQARRFRDAQVIVVLCTIVPVKSIVVVHRETSVIVAKSLQKENMRGTA